MESADDEAESIGSRSQTGDFNWTDVVQNFSERNADPSMFRGQDFLESTVLKAAFLRDSDMQVLVDDKGALKKYIVKDVTDDGKLVLYAGGSEMHKKINEIINFYDSSISCSHLDGVVLIEELAKTPKKIVRTVIQSGQYFLYHPPGDAEWLALVLKNHNSILDCMLFPRDMDEDKQFKLSEEDPIRRTLMMGSVGMQPLDRQFNLDKEMKSKIKSHAVHAIIGNSVKTRKSKDNLESQLGKMPECLFQVPLIEEGESEIYEGDVVEILNVRRDVFSQDRYFPAASPFFLSGTVKSSDGERFEVKVIDEGEETTYCIHISEGLLYPVGTAEKLGAGIRGERTDDAGVFVESVGGPKKCEDNQWRGYANVLLEDGDGPHIRPIVIRNVHVGILAEFSYIDSMECGSFLFPICNPRFLPSQFTTQCSIPVRFRKDDVNSQMLNELFREGRRDQVVQTVRYADFEMDYNNPVPLSEESLFTALDEEEDGGGEMMDEMEDGTADEKGLQPEEEGAAERNVQLQPSEETTQPLGDKGTGEWNGGTTTETARRSGENPSMVNEKGVAMKKPDDGPQSHCEPTLTPGYDKISREIEKVEEEKNDGDSREKISVPFSTSSLSSHSSTERAKDDGESNNNLLSSGGESIESERSLTTPPSGSEKKEEKSSIPPQSLPLPSDGRKAEDAVAAATTSMKNRSPKAASPIKSTREREEGRKEITGMENGDHIPPHQPTRACPPDEKEGDKMSADGIPSCSNNHTRPVEHKEMERNGKESKRMPSDWSKDEVPSKRSRLESPMENGVEGDNEKETRAPKRGEPIDSITLYELPPYQARRMTERSAAVRGGNYRAPFIRGSRPTSVDEKLVSGDEEKHRLIMENVLKSKDLLRMTDKLDLDRITPTLMTNFRNPIDWNSLEVQLFLDQFDVDQTLKDFVKNQDFDGYHFLSLKLQEVFNEFPILTDDFNEKLYFFGFIDKMKKIAYDDSLLFNPPPFSFSDDQ